MRQGHRTTSPPAFARRLFDAREQGASDQELRGIIAEGFKDSYFQDGGLRALGLSGVEVNDFDYLKWGRACSRTRRAPRRRRPDRVPRSERMPQIVLN
ncbi:hypothetical protein GCM10010350_72500 [Streptomyces galilaeus]|nr:hypothetical protein GCM10010350_72500 [Streptomyces galilaeus]